MCTLLYVSICLCHVLLATVFHAHVRVVLQYYTWQLYLFFPIYVDNIGNNLHISLKFRTFASM